MKRSLLILAAGAVTACGSNPPPEPPAPSGTVLGYSAVAPAAATYVFTDSSGFDIQGGAIGNINARIGTAGTANVAYAQNAGALEATITITDFDGSMVNSAMGGGPTATESDVTGAAVVTVAPDGAPTIGAMPELTRAAESVGLSKSFFRRFFARLPARAVQPGTSWVDTVDVTDDSGGTTAQVRDILTSTFVKDTVVNGRTLAVISSTADRTLSISGVNEGVEIKQTLTGTSTGRVLWDAERGMLVTRVESSELSGTFDLPQMGMTGLPVTARSNSTLTLQ